MKWYIVLVVATNVLLALAPLPHVAAWADNAHAIASDNAIFNCPELNSQEDIDLDKIMGKWYVVEVLSHRLDPQTHVTGSYVVDSCPIVHLRSREYATLSLLWKEDAGNLEYTFRIPDISRKPGFWISSGLQNGTLAEKQYNQFTGVVHVMKAVASDMVLTFCSRIPDNQLYSLLLAREHILQKSDKKGVHNLLSRRHLQIVNIRETCVNSAARRKENLVVVSWFLLSSVLINQFTL